MTTVLAALDGTATARPVLESALVVAELLGATVEAVHVDGDGAESPAWLASRFDVPLRVLHGDAASALLEAVDADDVVAAVFGARSTPSGRRPAGHIAMHVLGRASKPVVMVPPEAPHPVPGRVRRLLVPLEGDETSSRVVMERLRPMLVGDVDLVVLHVFTRSTVPRALDRSQRDLSLWTDEFVARFCPGAIGIEVRTGSVGAGVKEVTTGEDIDLVVLSWAQDSSGGHAAVVRDVLSSTTVPVLLLPAGPPASVSS